uniref:Protein sprouty n=1 Tax=Anopheles christyi TaxID=43041 RepID=A0A182K9K5_9DIPT
MDRRNGGTSLAPPRPPKSLPRVHRPRAPDPNSSPSPIISSPVPNPNPTAMIGMTIMIGNGAASNGGHQHQQQQQLEPATTASTQPPQLSPKPRHLIGGSGSVLGSTNLSNGNDNSSNLANHSSSRSGSSQPSHQPIPHQHHHHHNHPHQQSNRSIGSNSSTLSSVSSTSSTAALLRPQIAPLVPLHTRSSTPPPPPLPPHQRPTSPAGSLGHGSTFARRRLSPVATTSPPLHHPYLTSIPPQGASESIVTAATTISTPPVLLLPVDQPIVGGVTSNNSSNPTTPVTLAAPRPENERLANEYVDTPFGRGNGAAIGGANIPSSGALTGVAQGALQHRNLSLLSGEGAVVTVITGQPRLTHDRSRSPISSVDSHSDSVIRVIKSTEGRHGVTTTVTGSGQSLTNAGGIARSSSIITKQPTKKKEGSDRHELLELELHHHHHHRHHGRSAVATVGGGAPGTIGAVGVAGSDGLIGIGSITCPRCRRCRCEECQKPRPLPSHWLCDKSCLCSAETIIDYASCLCCVKALYYHCSKEHEFEREVVGPDGTIETETVSCADDPCSCVPHKRTTRWGCLGALSVALPCLWCYWPMRGCVAICARCYAKHSRHGCRCTQHPSAPSASFPPGSALSESGGILNGSMFAGTMGGNGGVSTGSFDGHETRAKGDPTDGDSPLQHLHHHLRHHLHHPHRSGASTDLTTPEKRLLDSSTDTY